MGTGVSSTWFQNLRNYTFEAAKYLDSVVSESNNINSVRSNHNNFLFQTI